MCMLEHKINAFKIGKLATTKKCMKNEIFAGVLETFLS